MDTLEISYIDATVSAAPVLWRNKSPQDVCRELYPDCMLEKKSTAPKSTTASAQYCDKYVVTKKIETTDGKTSKSTHATLIAIPEKP